jgi:class 3 adenylate cyclase/tetratricopeptide (TPR) repeat protein
MGVRCQACGVESGPQAKFCSECGVRLPSGCPSCGAELSSTARFCSQCGATIQVAGSVTAMAGSPAGAARPTRDTDSASLEVQFAAMQRAMPASLREQLLTDVDGENRVLTILFADLTGSVRNTRDLAPEDAAARVNDVLKAMVDAVLAYDGRINRLLGDAVLAFFGTPVAHENDPERAILAALRIRESVQRLGFDVTVGINTGELYLGAVGTDAHHEVTAMGTAINLAARLREKAAPGEILVGAATQQHTRRAFAFAERSVEAKGFADPIPAYVVKARLQRPDKARGIEGLRADLIGREEELGKLHEALAEVQRGRGQMVTLVGDGGVGKSRLVADLRERALADPATAPRWLEGRSLDVAMGVSYWPFLDLLRALFGWTVEDDEARRGARLVAVLQELVDQGTLDNARFRELVPVLAALLSIDPGTAWPAVAHVSPEQARQQTFLALRDLVLALARERGFVLVLDDLHWSDPLSLDVVSLLMDAITLAPLLLVCVYRPDREHKVWHLAGHAARRCAGRYSEIQLRELTPAQSRHLVASLLRIQDLPAAVADLILDKAQGNPFFVEEVVRALIDAGVVYRDGDRWRARPVIDDMAVPASIQSVILSRVDRLQADAKRVLQGASVIGRVFRRRVLAHVTQNEAELDQTLWELEERALIYEGRVTPEPEYAFQHQLTQETVYRNLVRRQREIFHRQVAAAIEALYADGLEEFYEQLAYHYEHGGATDQALTYLARAADKAVEQNALQQAIAFYDRAIVLATGERIGELRIRRAAVYLDLFRGAEAAADYEAVLDEARGAGDRVRELNGMLGLARALYIMSLDNPASDTVERSRALYEQAYDLARILGDRRAMVRSLLGRQWIADFIPAYHERTAANAREALKLSSEADDDDLRIESQIALFRHQGRADSVVLEERLLAELEARDLPKLNLALFTVLAMRLRWGDFVEGIKHADRATLVAAQLGVPPVQYPTFRAICLLGLGRYGAAWASLQREIVDDDHPFGRVVRDLGIGLHRAELFDNAGALDLLTDVANRGRELRRIWIEDWAEAVRGLALARLGRVEEVDWARFDLPEWPTAPRARVAGANAALAAGELDAALRRADSAIVCAAEQEAAHEKVAAQLAAARALVGLERAAEAVTVADEGLALAQEKGYLPLQWQLHAVRGSALARLDLPERAEGERQVAAAVVRKLAESIENPEQRRGFLAYPDIVATTAD